MLRLSFFSCALLALLMIGCDPSASESASGSTAQPTQRQTYSDEGHRPRDWSAAMAFELWPAEKEAGGSIYPVKSGSYTSEASIEQLVEQVFDLAFSGEALVYLPTVLGEPDRAQNTTPEALVTALNRFDTILTEDINTGEMVETSIDRSFSRSRVSAFVVHANVLNQKNGLVFEPHLLSVGEQVFDEETGDFRGITPRYFVELKEENANAIQQNFYFLTDSVGVFYLDHLGYHGAARATLPLGLDQATSNEEPTGFKIEQDWFFNSKEPGIKVDTRLIGRPKES